MPDLEYVFEPMSNGQYQVRLAGMFVCYSTHTGEKSVDRYLKSEGFESRQEYFNACLEEIDDMF